MIGMVWRIIITSLLVAAPLIRVEPAQADLHSYVQKYQYAKVPEVSLEKLIPYEHLIQYFSSFNYFLPNHKVSKDFLRALILAESGGNPTAVSRKDALGLGQIILETGRRAAQDLYTSKTQFRYVPKEKLQDLSRQDLLDPAINILLTCYLIAKYNYKFDGKLELVLSAWNAGEYTDSLALGQHAPYAETQDLIGKVNGYYLYLLRQKRYRIK